MSKAVQESSGTREALGSPLPEAELWQLFPTPLLKYLWSDSDELNRELRGVVFAKMEADRGKSVWHGSNIGGWHSPKTLDTWPHACVEQLKGRIRSLVCEMVSRVVPDPQPEHLEGWSLQAWANVSRHGAKNASHVHSHEKHTVWSGIYYVDTGEGPASGSAPSSPISSGLTKFEDRSGVPKEILRNRNPFEREVTVVPQPGLMVLFSSMLWHRVEPFLGDGSRITIAFNLSHECFLIPRYPKSQSSENAGFRGWMLRNFRGLMLPASHLKSRLKGTFRPLSAR